MVKFLGKIKSSFLYQSHQQFEHVYTTHWIARQICAAKIKNKGTISLEYAAKLICKTHEPIDIILFVLIAVFFLSFERKRR